jgi:hypothetical protein
VNETDNQSQAKEEDLRAAQWSPAKLWVAAGTAIAVVVTGWLIYSYHQSAAAASAAPEALPEVIVSKPLMRDVDSPAHLLEYISGMGTSSSKAICSSPSTRAPTKSGWHRPMPC